MKNNSRKTDESNSLGESLDDNLTIIQVKSAGVSSAAKKLSQQRDKTRLKAKHKNQYENQDRTIIVKPEAVDAVKLKQELADKTRILKKSTSSDNSTRIMSGKKNRASDATKLTTGSIINNRFVLEEVLGVGGMGKVYKAVDLRKKEARDKNPYIAIKVLNDEFREHPESLIALQREARKSQQLSHPNIVNVHDFDRDGDVVYMTMELLQGRSLDEVIANDYPHGMTEEQATPIINAIANAVLYAHQHGIVHSDLKPSNIFITDDNKAKIFDFGIARACKISQEQIDSTHTRDKTLFDPTELGALTPTYASLEMLQGEAPEPHDDIYSIACVFYELLTGEHPYQRMPADKAKDKIANKSLRIKKIAALRKSIHKEKNKAILKALEICGKDRFDNLELFIQAYNYKKKSKTPFIVSVLALVIILGIVFYPKIQEEYYFKQQANFIAMVQSLQVDSQQNEFLSINDHIISLDVKTKEYVLENIKSHWLSLVENRIEVLLKGNNYNEYFEHDSILLKMTQTYYPDSARVARLFESFEKQKFVEISRLNSQFNELLENLQVSELSSQSSEQAEIFKIINAVKGIEETHPLVKDQRLLLVYQSNIERVLNEYNLEEANSLLVKAELIFPDEILLQNLVDKSKSLELSNDNKLLNNDGYAFDNKVKNKLSSFSISKLKQKLVKRLEESDLSDEWDADVTQIYTQLNSKLGKRSTWLNEKKQTLASLYMQQSVIMRDKERLIEARRFLEKAKQFNSSIFGIEDEEEILLALENIVRVKHKAKQRLAKIAGLKTSLTTQLKAQEMQVAIRTYNDLKRILGRNDPYISREARQNIAQAYYTQARQLFVSKEYQQTLDIVASGLKFEAQHSGLRTLKKKAIKQYKILENSLIVAKKTKTKEQVKEKNTMIAVVAPKKITPQTSSTDTCKAKYAGYGRRKRANCYDTIDNKFRAPVMVVIPSGASVSKVFAISKYEITINDYNLYCQASGDCSKKTESGRLPITDISIENAKAYTQWLSQKTTKNYSLPSSQQWLHAAKSNNKAQYNDVNCRIKFGSKLLKGKILLAANTGQSNPWGLMNVVGNAREFVVDGGNTVARGGAHIDPIKDCSVNKKLDNIASGDQYTGFRIVRAIN